MKALPAAGVDNFSRGLALDTLSIQVWGTVT
jgi:hypothetical protein